jgi:hypothetical protein
MSEIYRLVVVLKNGQAVRLLFSNEGSARKAFVALGSGAEIADDHGTTARIAAEDISAVVLEDTRALGDGLADLTVAEQRNNLKAQNRVKTDPAIKMGMPAQMPPMLPQVRQ